MAFAGTPGNAGACVFVVNGNTAVIPEIEVQDNVAKFVSWEPLAISDPQIIDCDEAQETFYIETTAAEIDSLKGQQISEI